MEDLKCPNLIENARIARGRANAVPATERVACHYRRAKCVLPATPTAAGNAKIAVAWADLIPPGIRSPNPATNNLRRSMNPIDSSLTVRNS
jgi:hypothetical protein